MGKSRTLRMVKLVAGLAVALSFVATEPRQFSQDQYIGLSSLENSAEDLFDYYIGNDDYFEKISNHGCWCAQLNSENDMSGLGGGTIDQLDHYCKEWIMARKCFHNFRGGSCYGMDTSSLGYFINAINTHNCSPAHEPADQPKYEHDMFPVQTCEVETCLTDTKYVMEFRTFYNDNKYDILNGDWQPVTNAICDPSAHLPQGDTCVGSGADHRLEKLENILDDSWNVIPDPNKKNEYTYYKTIDLSGENGERERTKRGNNPQKNFFLKAKDQCKSLNKLSHLAEISVQNWEKLWYSLCEGKCSGSELSYIYTGAVRDKESPSRWIYSGGFVDDSLLSERDPFGDYYYPGLGMPHKSYWDDDDDEYSPDICYVMCENPTHLCPFPCHGRSSFKALCQIQVVREKIDYNIYINKGLEEVGDDDILSNSCNTPTSPDNEDDITHPIVIKGSSAHTTYMQHKWLIKFACRTNYCPPISDRNLATFWVTSKTANAYTITIYQDLHIKVTPNVESTKNCIDYMFQIDDSLKDLKSEHVDNWTYTLTVNNWSGYDLDLAWVNYQGNYELNTWNFGNSCNKPTSLYYQIDPVIAEKITHPSVIKGYAEVTTYMLHKWVIKFACGTNNCQNLAIFWVTSNTANAYTITIYQDLYIKVTPNVKSTKNCIDYMFQIDDIDDSLKDLKSEHVDNWEYTLKVDNLSGYDLDLAWVDFQGNNQLYTGNLNSLVTPNGISIKEDLKQPAQSVERQDLAQSAEREFERNKSQWQAMKGGIKGQYDQSRNLG